MNRYAVSLFYPNGSVSHALSTSSHRQTRIHVEAILRDDDLRETASRLLVKIGERVLFDAPPAAVKYGEEGSAITWPRAGAPTKYKDYKRVTVSLPYEAWLKAREEGEGNVSRGVLKLALKAYPELESETLL